MVPALGLGRFAGVTWAVADQGLVALLSLSLGIAFGQSGGAAGVGTFAILSAVGLVSVGTLRVLILEPWALKGHSSSVPPEFVSAVGALAVFFAGGGFVLTFFYLGDWSISGLAALMVVIWSLQDVVRHLAFSNLRPARAFWSDFTVLTLFLASILVSVVCEWPVSVEGLTVLWTVGLLAGSAMRPWGRLRFRTRGVVAWWRREFQLDALPLAKDMLAFHLGVTVSLFIFTAFASVENLGVVRSLVATLSPFALVVAGLSAYLLPRLTPDRKGGLLVLRIELVLGASLLLFLPAFLLVGERLIQAAFGLDAELPQGLLFIAFVQSAGFVLSTPWVVLLKVRGLIRYVALPRLVLAIVAIILLIMVDWFQSLTGFFLLLGLQGVGMFIVAVFLSSGRHHHSRQVESS